MTNGFLPENENIFPINAWKRRLDFIEEHFVGVEKQILELDTTAARKDIVGITKILKEMDYSFVSTDDREHILNGVILPLLNSKNRIEDATDLLDFLDAILEFILFQIQNIEDQKANLYLRNCVMLLERYDGKIENAERERIYDKILGICKKKNSCEGITLTVLGLKSDIADAQQRNKLQKEIIERGKDRIADNDIARTVLVTIYRQTAENNAMSKSNKTLLESIRKTQKENEKILELYYCIIIDLMNNSKIELGFSIDEIITQIEELELSAYLLISANRIKCDAEEDMKKKLEIAINAIEKINVEDIDDCRLCWNYTVLLTTIILNKINLNETIEQKFIDNAIKLCCSQEDCHGSAEIIVKMLNIYINNIDSQYEKRELCKRAIDICERKALYEDWVFFVEMNTKYMEKREYDIYIEKNQKYKLYLEADEKVSRAIKIYVQHDIILCGNMLLEASECFDNIFAGKYNPALMNICYMARRSEIPGLNISVIDVLNSITWQKGDAFLQINKALAYFAMQEDWIKIREQIRAIVWNVEGAVQWWNQEDVVGKKEKALVLLLLVLEKKIIFNTEMEEILHYAINNIVMPNEIKKEIQDIVTG